MPCRLLILQVGPKKTLTELTGGKVSYHENKDVKGPITLALSAKNQKTGSHIVVFGNSTFVNNTYRSYPNNFTFFSNALSWTTRADNLIAFDIPQIENKPVFIAQSQLGIIFYFSVIISPLLLFGIAIVTYRRKRVL